MDIITIDGSVALTVARTARHSTAADQPFIGVSSGELEVVRFDGRPKITARSIVKLLGLVDPAAPPTEGA